MIIFYSIMENLNNANIYYKHYDAIVLLKFITVLDNSFIPITVDSVLVLYIL